MLLKYYEKLLQLKCFSFDDAAKIFGDERKTKNILYTLKKKGLLLVMAPDWETQYKIFYQDPTHIHPYTTKSMDRILNMCGFHHVKAEKFIQLPCVWKNRLIKFLSHAVGMAGPVKKIYKNKFIRFSRELMVLGSGRK